MTYKELKEKGTFVGESDIYDNGVYGGTDYFYLYNDNLYMRHEPTNALTYDGKVETTLVMDNVKKNLEEYTFDYFKELCSFETYEKLCEMNNVKTIEELGTFVAEEDIRHNGHYGGKEKFYLYKDNLYCRHEPTNALTYDGKVETFLVMDNVEKTLKEYNADFWSDLCSKETYKKLCEMYNLSSDYKKLLFVETNGYNMLVSIDENNMVRYMVENNNEIFPNKGDYDDYDDFKKAAKDYLSTVEDDSSWELIDEPVDDIEKWLGIDYNDPETPRIVSETKTQNSYNVKRTSTKKQISKVQQQAQQINAQQKQISQSAKGRSR